MKTLAVLMVLLVGCAEALPGEEGSDAPVSGAGGLAMAGAGGAPGTGGQYVPDPAPDCIVNPSDSTVSLDCSITRMSFDKAGSRCLSCGGIEEPPPGGCAIRPGPNHVLQKDVLCVAQGRCEIDCPPY